MRLITDNLPFVISYLDNERRYRFVNRTVETWFGRSAEEIFGRTIGDILGQEAHDAVTPQVAAALRGEAQHDERVISYPDGKTRTVEPTYVPDIDESETVRGCFAFGQDTTERKRAEAALRESEALFRAFVDNIPVEIVIRDTESRFLFVNAAWESDEGPTNEQIIGMSVHEVYSKEGADLYQTQDRAVLETGQVVDQVVEVPAMPGRKVLSEPIALHTIKFPIRDAQGDITRIGAIGINITERKRAEQEIQKLNEDLERRVEERTAELRAAQDTLVQNERLSTLGQLTATVSHELRNPLGVIRTSAFTLRGKLTDGDPRAERTLDRIERNVVRCDRIIDELLDFTRITELEPVPTFLDVWLEETLKEQTLPSGVALRLAFDRPNIAVSVDHDRFRRAIINIFDNACQAMIGMANEDTDSKENTLTVKTQESAGRVEVIFLDTGPGIPPDVYKRIFEPLFSTKGFGVGLGLPVVKHIMEQHGGGIEIETEEGRGTRVCLWLPTGPPTR
jgi:PAS domain S-box-containing protein